MTEKADNGKVVLGKLAPLKIRAVPIFVGFAAAIGPGIVWAALAQGSGELIWWPYLTARYGVAFIGLLLPAALIQYFVNQEIIRYTITTGETFFAGMARISKALTVLLWIMLTVTFIWFGGYASGAGTALRSLFGWPVDPRLGTLFWAYLIIALFVLVIVLGRVIYNVIERFMTFIVIVTVGGLIFAILDPTVLSTAGSFFSAYFNPTHIFVQGFPSDFVKDDLNILLTAIAFAGMGGFYNVMYSYWVRDKGHGMSKYIGRVTSPVTGEPETISATGFGFEDNEGNRRNYRDWIKFMRFDNLFGIFVNLFTVTLMAWLAWALLMPKGKYPAGWEIAVVQSEFFAHSFGVIGRIIFLVVAAAFLADSWLGVADAVARMHSDFFFTNFKRARRWSFRRWYYIFVIILTISSVITISLAKPGTLIIIGGILSFFAMAAYMPLLIYLNYFMVPKSLPKWTRPRISTLIAASLVSVIYLSIAVFYVIHTFS